MFTNIMTYIYYVDINVIYHYLLYIGKQHSFWVSIYTKKCFFFQRHKGEVKLEERKLWKSKWREFVFDNRQLVFKWQSSGLRNLCWRAHVFILIMSGSCYNDLQGDGDYLNVLLFLRSSVYIINTASHIVP